MTQPHTLTPEDIMTLRASCKGLRNLGGGFNAGFPYILYLPADDAFCLHAYGSPQAKSPDPAILAAMLRAERFEPGFIRRVLSSEEPCTVASLNPAERAQAHARTAQETARTLAYRQEQEAAQARRMTQLDASRFSLDDL